MSGGVKPRALIAMSGGVDSSVAALLAMRMGYECEGVTMDLFGDSGGAERVAGAMGIPHKSIDLSEEFRERVIEPFVSSYEGGRTPNPCTLCNTYIKFGRLYEHMLAGGFDKLVTGHYARIEIGPDGAHRLARAFDVSKDQSYFLYGLTREKLEHILFPLGGLTKREVRGLASEAGLESAERRDSQDICFLQGGGHAGFITAYRGKPPAGGEFVDGAGRALGRHGGIERYTIGQRKGLGMSFGRPLFVKEIRPETREVVLADEDDVFASRVSIADVNWLTKSLPGTDEEQNKNFRAKIMIRYNTKPVWAKVSPAGDRRVLAEFDTPVRAPAKGQAAVMYDGEVVLGGGRIDTVSFNAGKI